MVSSIAKFRPTHRSARFIICGDVNDLDPRNIHVSVLFLLIQIVSFATRESNTLDLVFTDIAESYDNCTILAPISANDHCAISLDQSDGKYTLKVSYHQKREITHELKISLTKELAETNCDFIHRIPSRYKS